MLLLETMAHMEGYFTPGSRPERNNNPLDLMYGPEAKAFGATGGDPRFAIFPDAKTGWLAGARWLGIPARFSTSGDLIGGYLGATLKQVINRFAPPNENDTVNYLNYVCAHAEVTEDTILTTELLELPNV